MDAPDAPAGPDREPGGPEPALRPGERGRGRRVGPALAAPARQRFGFLQFDIAGALGLADGRYLAREAVRGDGEAGGDEERVLVVQTLTVPPKLRKRPGRRPGRAAEPPAELTLTRVTAVFAERGFADEEGARRWMRDTARDEEARAAALDAAVGLLNRALHALAVAEGDPYIREINPQRLPAARIGHGLGPELAEGNFSECLALPTGAPRRRRRTDEVGAQERVAAILGGRQAADVCETFLLRARADLDAGRGREAALGLAIALDTLLLELDDALADPAHLADLGLLRGRHADAFALSHLARTSPLAGADLERLAELIGICERVLRRRRLLRG